MNRRRFLVTSAALATGCGRRDGPVVTSADRDRIAAEWVGKEQHFAILERFRVPATATRTTPTLPVDALKTRPELNGLTKVAVRLHPRFGDEPKPDESKIGGRFLWPADETWPVDEATRVPFIPVLQLRLDDAPPRVEFRPGSDLLQLLWLPRAAPGAPLTIRLFWRKRDELSGPPAVPPPINAASPFLVPVPCRVFPERVQELPPSGLLPDRLAKTVGPGYDECFAACPGTKIGGYPFGATRDQSTACPRCRKPADFLLAVSDAEWDDAGRLRWMPQEERTRSAEPDVDKGFGGAVLLLLPGGRVNVFVCRRCDGWPVFTG